MSTTERLFEQEDIDGIVEDLKEWPNMGWGDDKDEWVVSPFISFYFLYDSQSWVDTSLLMVDIHEEFEQLTGCLYAVATHPESERPHPYHSKRLPDLREFARKTKRDDHFLFKATNEKNHGSSPTCAAYFWRKPGYMNDEPIVENKIYSTIQLYYRWSWWLENKETWRKFVLRTIERLSPEIVHSGFAMATPLEHGGRAALTVWERALAPHFFGLDIDDSWAMDMQGDGIRPPTWGFLLSDIWRQKLDLTREQVKDRLYHDQISITEVSNGLWIELGAKPSLYPVEQGCPLLPSILNKVIKSIRNDHTDLVGFPQWDDDPNQRFNSEDSMRWLQRFDDDSDWPSEESRQSKAPAAVNTHPMSQDSELRAKAGEPCPRPGRWQSVDSSEQIRRYAMAEVLDGLNSPYGVTVWRYLGP